MPRRTARSRGLLVLCLAVMPDLCAPVGASLEVVGPLAGRALKYFIATTVGMIAVVAACGLAAVVSAWPAGFLGVELVVAVVVVGGALVAWFVALKRAVVASLAYGLRRLGLGQKAMSLIFGWLESPVELVPHGQRHLPHRLQRQDEADGRPVKHQRLRLARATECSA